jgi:hypothetical protein
MEARRARLASAPRVAEDLITGVIMRTLEGMRPELEMRVKQRTAALLYQEAKRARAAMIMSVSARLFDVMREEMEEDLGKTAILDEIRQREYLRSAIRHWRTWARGKRKAREAAERDRAAMFGQLTGMGLSKSVRGREDVESLGMEMSDMRFVIERLDEFEVDDAIHQVSRACPALTYWMAKLSRRKEREINCMRP